LKLGGSGSGTFDASLIGTGAQYDGFAAFAKVDNSTWTLTGTNTGVLPWTVQQGTVNVTGTLANSTFAVTGGTLLVNGTVGPVTVDGGVPGGNGTVGTTVVNSGALSPGNSIGAITVVGNLTFGAVAIYRVEVNPTV
jgi:hypothetical protein